jgi:hypothetical protein
LRRSSDLPTGALRRYGVGPIGLAAGASAVKLGNSDKAEEERRMDVINAIHSRRSIRSYHSKSVDRYLIESVIWDAAQAPPPFSGQVPWTFNVIEGLSASQPLAHEPWTTPAQRGRIRQAEFGLTGPGSRFSGMRQC